MLSSRPFSAFVVGDLYVDICPHHVIEERRPAVLSHKDWLNEETDLVDVVPEEFGDIKFIPNQWKLMQDLARA